MDPFFAGNLSLDESKRKLVSREVWNCLRYYFKDCPEFDSTVDPCVLCEVRGFHFLLNFSLSSFFSQSEIYVPIVTDLVGRTHELLVLING